MRARRGTVAHPCVTLLIGRLRDSGRCHGMAPLLDLVAGSATLAPPITGPASCLAACPTARPPRGPTAPCHRRHAGSRTIRMPPPGGRSACRGLIGTCSKPAGSAPSTRWMRSTGSRSIGCDGSRRRTARRWRSTTSSGRRSRTGWARRPPRPDQAPLPPVATDARPLFGRHLRRVCLSLLHQHGELALRDLHLLLILHGFTLTGSAPVKALADALGHEHDHGRVVRVRRGVYCPPIRMARSLGLIQSSERPPRTGIRRSSRGQWPSRRTAARAPSASSSVACRNVPRSRSSSAMAPWR